MKYAVNTTWKHSKPIDWDWMNKFLQENGLEGVTTYWFEIDKVRHGSLAIFQSKEAFESFKERRDAIRKETNDSGIAMTSENVGYIKAKRGT